MRAGGWSRREVSQQADHAQIFEAAQVRVEMRLFGHVAEALLVADQVVPDGSALEQDFACRRLDERGDHFHSGRFAGAVGPQVAGDLAGARGEADVVYRDDSAEVLRDVAKLEHTV